MLLLSSADFFSKFTLKKNSFRNTIGMSNGLYSDLGPNCLQRLSVDDKSHQLTPKMQSVIFSRHHENKA